MQKYSPIDKSTPNMCEDSESGSFYWCADADNRIEQLTRALQSCLSVLERQQQSVRQFQTASANAISEANQALALMGS